MNRLFLILLVAALAAPALAGAAKQTALVRVGAGGYTPATVTLKPGIPAEITFLREAEGGCMGELLIPQLGLKKKLPLNQPVKVAFTPAKGRLDFSCGMEMVHGTIQVP